MIPLLHTPEGVRDIYGDEMADLRGISDAVCTCMKTYGFREIQTPSFEYFDVFSSERGTVPSKDMYKFIDRDGNTLVLRPDMTPQVARCAATYWRDEAEPLRLYYAGNTFVDNSGYQLRLKETTQAGVELFGDDSVVADAEVVALTVECLKKTGLKKFQIEIGNAGFFRALANECQLSADDEEELRRRIKSKNLFGVSDFLTERKISGKTAELLLSIPELFGSEEILDRAASMTENEAALASLDRLRELSKCLKLYGVDRYVSFDLGMLSKYRYYTGIIFRAITYGTGEALASGGRYDSLAEQFGRQMPAIGMSITLDTLLAALQRADDKQLPFKVHPTCVVYREGAYAEAIKRANELRKEENCVCLRKATAEELAKHDGEDVWSI